MDLIIFSCLFYFFFIIFNSWQSSFERVYRTCRIFFTTWIVVCGTKRFCLEFILGINAYITTQLSSRTWFTLSLARIVWLFSLGCHKCGHTCKFGGIASAIHQVSSSLYRKTKCIQTYNKHTKLVPVFKTLYNMANNQL